MDTRTKFTNPKLRNLKAAPAGKRDYYYDPTLPGLGITVTDKGTNS